LKRVEPYGKRSPWQTLSEMPASHARNEWSDTKVGASAIGVLVMAIQVNLTYPVW